MEARRIGTRDAFRRRQGYVPMIGLEHCPTCWIGTSATNGLRTEQHHNGDRVSVAICDACGLFAIA